MAFYRFYIPSMLLSVILTILALITLAPAFGFWKVTLYTPASTVALLGLCMANCIIRADMKRKQFNR